MPTTAIQTDHGSYLMPTLQHARVSDAMHPGILTCDPDATLTDVARMMSSHHVHAVAVMGVSHEAATERLAYGIISDLQLVRAGISAGGEQSAASMALQPVISVEPETPLREAADLMLSHDDSHLVVFDSKLQRPIGILSTLDVAGVLAWGES